MIQVLKKYVENYDYAVAAAYGIDTDDTHIYYIRKDFEHSEEIAERISECNYAWYVTGEIVQNHK
jgi:hypothetical protein